MTITESSRRRLVRLCAGISGDHAAAEDLAQETLLEAWRNAHKLHDPAGFDRWLAAIARNVCLRWARRRGREVPLVAVEDEPAAEEAEHVGADLGQVLALVPAATRDALVHRYVHDLPTAEIGRRLGLSEAAVSMRLTRGKAALRRALADDGWRQTRVWCRDCGRARLELRRTPSAVCFRCPRCTRSTTAAEFRLDNPLFARLLEGLVRPTAILRRTADWVHVYFAAGAGGRVDCTRCGRANPLTRFRRDRDGRPNDGLFAECAWCGEQVSSSVAGLVVALPEVSRLRGEHPRSRSLPQRAISFAGRPAILVRHQDVLGSAGVDVVLERETLRVLEVA